VNEISRPEPTHKIIGCALAVHQELGPGLLESSYEMALMRELELAGMACRRQVELPLNYKGEYLNCGYRIDLLVEESVIVEIKAVECLKSIHEAQIISYMKLSGKRVGLLINFHVTLLRHGIRRFVV
jgi:GxxExxY protein